MPYDGDDLDSDVCTAVVRCMIDGHQGMRECTLGKSSWRMLHDVVRNGFNVPDFIPVRVLVLAGSEGVWHTCSCAKDLENILKECPLSVDIVIQGADDFNNDGDTASWNEREDSHSSSAAQASASLSNPPSSSNKDSSASSKQVRKEKKKVVVSSGWKMVKDG